MHDDSFRSNRSPMTEDAPRAGILVSCRPARSRKKNADPIPINARPIENVESKSTAVSEVAVSKPVATPPWKLLNWVVVLSAMVICGGTATCMLLAENVSTVPNANDVKTSYQTPTFVATPKPKVIAPLPAKPISEPAPNEIEPIVAPPEENPPQVVVHNEPSVTVEEAPAPAPQLLQEPLPVVDKPELPQEKGRIPFSFVVTKETLRLLWRAMSPPSVPATAEEPVPAIRIPGTKTECYETAVQFVNSPKRAMTLADEQKKLVFLLHVSGNFEDPGFT